MTTVAKLEALLFVEGGDVKKADLAKTLGIDIPELESIAKTLKHVLTGHGIALVQTDTTLALRSAPEVAEFLKQVHADSLSGEVGKAGLETLSILIYRGPSTRAEIDYIRGVNSASSVRGLLIRGLIEREKIDGSVYKYKPTVDALALLGVESVDQIPELEEIQQELKKLENKEDDNSTTKDNE